MLSPFHQFLVDYTGYSLLQSSRTGAVVSIFTFDLQIQISWLLFLCSRCQHGIIHSLIGLLGHGIIYQVISQLLNPWFVKPSQPHAIYQHLISPNITQTKQHNW